MRLRLLIPFALLLLLLPTTAGSAAPSKPAKKWPSVAKQLARDHVIPGSALAKLIRANQDASVLAPWESDDDAIGLPLWLRVLWRKAHPDSLGTAEDPSGVYPLVLREQHDWFVSHQDLRRGKPEPGTEPIKNLVAGENIPISGPAFVSRAESDIRVYPGDPEVMVAACNNNTGSGGQTQMYSTDGGITWGQTTLNLIMPDVFHSDPAVDFTSDGMAWSLTIGVVSTTETRVRAYHSGKDAQGHHDYRNWVFDGTPSDNHENPDNPTHNQTDADKELMWIDHSVTSPFRDTIYSIWRATDPRNPGQPRATFVSHRTRGDSGTWSAPVRVSAAAERTNPGGDIKTNADGDVFAFWPAPAEPRQVPPLPPRIFLRKSAPGGTDFAAPVVIAPTFGSFQIGVPAFNGINGGSHRPLIYVSGGAYRNGNRNMVYAVWMDFNRANCTICSLMGLCPNPNPTCKTRIWFSRSTNGGDSWAPQQAINDQPFANDQFNPRLVVDEANGELTVIYYDTVQDPNRLKTHVFAQRSADDGVHWSVPIQVTTAASDETQNPPDIQYGDYNGISGHLGVVFPTWTDHRDPNDKEAIWTARLTDVATPAPPPPPTSLTATATSLSQVSLTWTASPGATGYEVQRKSDGGPYQTVGAPTSASYIDTAVVANKTYVYIVRALNDQTGASGWSAPDLATTFFFTDDPLSVHGTVKAVHITELRTAVNLVRAAAGLTAFSFTDPTPTLIKAVHISELRSALDPARNCLGVPALVYTDPTPTLTPQVTVVRAVHIQELRAGVK